MNHRVALTAALLTLGAPVAAVAQPVTLRPAYNEAVRGGLTMDGWGALSTPTTYATGSFRLRIPRGGRVVWARLLSDVVMRRQDVETAMVPAGPAGSPREVVVGGTNGGITRRLEGRPDFVRTVSFTYGTFSTDVTAAVRFLVGSVAPGGEVEVPVRERGDEGPSDGSVSVAPVFEGHALAVVYELDYGPRRNLTVYEGNAAGTVRVTDLPLRSPVANRCPAASLRGEAFPLSVALASEYSVCQENNPLTINGTLVSSALGGADDWPDDPRSGCNGPIAGLVSAGSFGGAEAGDGAAAGAPVGLEGDNVTGPPAAPRRDDELYDARTFLADGVTRMDFNFGGDGDEVVMAIGLQALARDQMTDADDDGFDDTAEGDCAVDTDRDGTPDYLDLDSDNDCRPDRMETAAGRTDPAMPGAPDANCTGGAPVCDRAVGVCGCRASADCPTATPVCDAAARFCATCTANAQCAGRAGLPACATTGPRQGQCVGCVTSAQCAAGETCDAATNACVAPADAGTPDAGARDAGVADGGAIDAGGADAGAIDAGVADAGSPDVSAADAGSPDVGAVDAGARVDAGVVVDAGGALVVDAMEDGGCGCRAGARPPGGGGLAVAVAVALLARRRTRRGRRALPPTRDAVGRALALVVGLAACDAPANAPASPAIDAATSAPRDVPAADLSAVVDTPVVDVPVRECDTPDGCAWIEAYQGEVVGRLAGQQEVSPGVTLAHRASAAERSAARAYLRDALVAHGLDTELRAYATGQNVVATLPATVGTGAPRLVVGAHYDSVPAGPGAADDGTGVAIVLAAARYLAALPRRDHAVDFVLFDQEEIGLVGSAAYASALMSGGTAVDSVHCFDMVSFDGDGDGAVELWSPSAGLEDLYRRHGTPRGIPVHAVTFASSDHQSFLRRGFAAVGVGEEFVGGDHTPHYHRATDTFERIDFTYLARITRLALDVLADRVVE